MPKNTKVYVLANLFGFRLAATATTDQTEQCNVDILFITVVCIMYLVESMIVE